jgi:hypothetical protein
MANYGSGGAGRNREVTGISIKVLPRPVAVRDISDDA